ncbi:MAG TPA: insulinase family protein, partial [Phenylobacterium sp.]|nr:insulinase family protein [Phenylobacterium sp.]
MFIPLTRLVAPLLAAGLILVGLCPGAAQAAAPPIEYRERVLENGLRVLSAVDETTPNVTVQVWYGVGAKDDPEGRSGFAHLFEHMMFKTTRNMPAE